MWRRSPKSKKHLAQLRRCFRKQKGWIFVEDVGDVCVGDLYDCYVSPVCAYVGCNGKKKKIFWLFTIQFRLTLITSLPTQLFLNITSPPPQYHFCTFEGLENSNSLLTYQIVSKVDFSTSNDTPDWRFVLREAIFNGLSQEICKYLESRSCRDSLIGSFKLIHETSLGLNPSKKPTESLFVSLSMYTTVTMPNDFHLAA